MFDTLERLHAKGLKTMIRRHQRWTLVAVATLLVGLVGGCPIDIEDVLDDLEELELTIDNSVNVIQGDDPRDIVVLPSGFVDRGDTIIIADDADVIVDVTTDLTVEVLPDITLLGFENLTGYDIYITYAVDDEVQGALVYDGETLLLEYGCLTYIDLLTEEDFEPLTGLFVGEFDLSDVSFGPRDFYCGEALIITIDPFGVTAAVEYIDLID